MSTTLDATAFDRSTEPLFRILAPEQVEQIVHLRADEALQNRVDQLANKCTEGELTDEERAEYEGYVRANSFIATLQLRARKHLVSREGA
jgi:hypothetical protein